MKIRSLCLVTHNVACIAHDSYICEEEDVWGLLNVIS